MWMSPEAKRAQLDMYSGRIIDAALTRCTNHLSSLDAERLSGARHVKRGVAGPKPPGRNAAC